jgi:hypothetical protein
MFSLQDSKLSHGCCTYSHLFNSSRNVLKSLKYGHVIDNFKSNKSILTFSHRFKSFSFDFNSAYVNKFLSFLSHSKSLSQSQVSFSSLQTKELNSVFIDSKVQDTESFCFSSIYSFICASFSIICG